jgi:Ion channel
LPLGQRAAPFAGDSCRLCNSSRQLPPVGAVGQNARWPGWTCGAAEALATTVPLFLLLFASAYYVMARASPASFSHHLTRSDALYFTVTTFSTVGYGDITAVSQTARLVVTAQMILDLLALGLGIRMFIGEVQLARQAHPDPAGPGTTSEQPEH